MKWECFLKKSENLTDHLKMGKIIKGLPLKERIEIYKKAIDYFENLEIVNWVLLEKIECFFDCIHQEDLKSDVDFLFKKYSDILKKNVHEMKSIRREIKVEDKDVEDYKQKILVSKSPIKNLDRLFHVNLSEFIELKNIETNSFSSIFSKKIIKNDFSVGVATHKTDKEHFNNYNTYQIFSIVYVNNTFECILNELDYKDIINKSDVLNETDRTLLISSINLYKEKKYIESISLIVPRIESLLRNIIKLKGGNILAYNKKLKIFTYKNLNEILKTKEILNLFSDEMIKYLRVLFANNFGLNIRNELSHGILNESNLLSLICTKILILFLYISSCEF